MWNATLPPEPEAGSPPAAAKADGAYPVGGAKPEPVHEAQTIEPVAFQPSSVARKRALPRLRGVPFIVAGGLALLVVTSWFMFTARPVHINVTPGADDIAVAGGLLRLKIGGRYLLRPGAYEVTAKREGYVTGVENIEVTGADNQTFTLALAKLPGLLTVTAGSVAGATVSVDGERIGTTPLTDTPLSPGTHSISVLAERYRPYHGSVDIAGAGEQQTLELELVPDWAMVTVASSPAGASVLIDEQEVGVTPFTAEVRSGTHDITLRLPGYKTWQNEVFVVAREDQTLPTIELVESDGLVAVRSRPGGAALTVNGTYRGQTPVELALPPGQTYRMVLTKAGYRSATRNLTVKSGEDASLSVALTAELGTVRVTAKPADATLYVDGEPRGPASQAVELTAVPHTLEVRREGYDSYSTRVTPRPGFDQAVNAVLAKTKVAKVITPADPASVTTSLGGELRLVQPGQFVMGASRREPGRRANEVLHPVQITRAFYIGVKEVTNAEFRRFEPKHSSGELNGIDLNADNQPVVEIAWQDAARFCNWLSEQDSLPPAYEETSDGFMTLRSPMTTGYRLPTEAEWAWAGRYAGSPDANRYPWGDAMPPTDKSGNYADTDSARLVSKHLARYRDGFPATAPVGSFAPNRLGLFDIGGNVAEWTNDWYAANPVRSSGPVTDPQGPGEGQFKVARGSSWMHGVAAELRLAYRDYSDVRRPDLGFRIARNVR